MEAKTSSSISKILSKLETYVVVISACIILILKYTKLMPSGESTFAILFILLPLLAIHSVKLESKIDEISKETKQQIHQATVEIKNILESSDTIVYHSFENHYREVTFEIERATKCQATYFLRSCWLKNRPTDLEWYKEYEEKLIKKLSKGLLEFEWLITIENKEKFECLIDELKTMLLKYPEILRETNSTRVLVIPDNMSDILLLNIQITNTNGKKILFVGIPDKTGHRIASGFKVKNQKVAESFEKYFDILWNSKNALPLIEGGKINISNLKSIGYKVCRNAKEVDKFVDEIKNLIERGDNV